jgi:cell wall-associated NlpC family hydrolase
VSWFRTNSPEIDQTNNSISRADRPRAAGRILTSAAVVAAAATTIMVGSAPASEAATTQAHHLTQQARLTAIRLGALRWAEHQVGRWYCWGGTGPSCYDCSGLVVAAYQHAGIWLPRSTYAMLGSSKLRWIPARDRRPGDLAFYGPGHVELVTSSGTFGALDYGTQVGWHRPSVWWYPTMYFEVR